jgi:hypothetical protein
MSRRPDLPPCLLIVLPFEGAPRIYSDAQTDAESNRLCDWICSHPDLAGLLDRAIEIREAWERAA